MNRVLITGAGRGIGLACAKKFLNEGWEVVAHYNKSKQFVDLLSNDRFSIFEADFSFNPHCDNFISYIKNCHNDKKYFNALVNNVGVYDNSRLLILIESLFKINVITPTLLTLEVFNGMKENNGGNIVNISSISARHGSPPDRIFYGQSKRALEGLTRTLSREGARYGICVNTVRPGITNTDFHEGYGKDLEARAKKNPMGRMAEPHEIARVVFNLCDKNYLVTGQTVTVSGGE